MTRLCRPSVRGAQLTFDLSTFSIRWASLPWGWWYAEGIPQHAYLPRLDKRISMDDVQMYADDFLLSRVFHTKQQLQESFDLIPVFLQHLRSYGLKINVSKTVRLYRVAEKMGRDCLKWRVSNTSTGKYFCVCGGRAEYIPVRTEHVYLGCILSLYDFEAKTIQHRVRLGQGQYRRLKGILLSNRYLTQTKRARLWRACVWSSVSYGLSCVGMTSALLRALSASVTTITRLPSHITKVTSREVYAKLSLLSPADMLVKKCQQLCARLELARRTLPSTDIMCNPQLLEYAQLVQQQMRDASGSQHYLVQVSDTVGVPCPVCGLYFRDHGNMKSHLTTRHPTYQQPQPIPIKQIRREDVSVDGMPTCRACGRQFLEWRELLRHVSHRRCEGRPPDKPEVAEVIPVSRRHELLTTWCDRGTPQLARDLAQHGLRKEMLEHCCVCRQWITSSQFIKSHIHRSHRDIYELHNDPVVSNCQLLVTSITDPCTYCGKPVPAKHRSTHAFKCPVLYQAAPCCRLHGDSQPGPGRNRLPLRRPLDPTTSSLHGDSYGHGQSRPGTGQGRRGQERPKGKWKRPNGKGPSSSSGWKNQSYDQNWGGWGHNKQPSQTDDLVKVLGQLWIRCRS